MDEPIDHEPDGDREEVEEPPFESLEGVMAGPYRIDALIGQGATGSVYLGAHNLIGSQVAIKVLHQDVLRLPGMGERFVREARASNMADSPHVLHIRDFGKLDDGRDYAVMDFLRGLPLDSLIESEGALELWRAIGVMVQVASGLAAAHQAGVLHRDIKPSNLFVTEGPNGDHVFILDFGIAKLLEAPACSQDQTMEGWLVGTPGYCAPEQALNEQVGPAADVYAFGTVAYEMLTGRALFDAPSVVELLADKVRAWKVELDLPADTPATLVDLLGRMLARDPADRPSMREVESCLRALVSPAPVSFPPVAAERVHARGKSGAIILLAALLGLVGAVTLAVLRSPAKERSAMERPAALPGSIELAPRAAATVSSEAPASSVASVPPASASALPAAPRKPRDRPTRNSKGSATKDRVTKRPVSQPPPGLVDPFAEN